MIMPKVLVFGASGAIGRFLLPRLSPENEVLPVSRREMAGWLRGDLFDADMIWPACDVAISLGPLDAFTRWTERAGMSTLRRIIAFSSMSAESKRDSADAHERELAQRLRTSEDTLRTLVDGHAIALTIFRPTLIYGAGIDRSLAPIARFVRRWRMLPVPSGARGLRQPVHADDLAGAVQAALATAATFGKTYELGGGERLPFDDMIERIRAAQPVHSVRLPLPAALLRIAARWRGDISGGAVARLVTSLTADNTAAARDFGYAPRGFVADDVLRRQNTPTV